VKPGAKYFEWEAKGVPLRLEIGPRDVQAGQVMAARRTGVKAPMKLEDIAPRTQAALDEIQLTLFNSARSRRDANSLRPTSKAQFTEFLKAAGGFAYAGFCGSADCEAEIKKLTSANIRLLPDPEFRTPQAPTTCIWCGKPSVAEAVWAQAY
jgi:prolyl-tRNA synthetase